MLGVPAAVNIVKGDHDPADTDHDQYYHDLVNLPPGFRFHPTDEEIITHYLTQKVIKPSFTASAIGQVDLNKCEPWDLPQKAKIGEKEWFFFCQRDRKYPTGMRTNRATDSGYWKATGKDKEIYRHGRRGSLVGMKKTLVFYKGRAPKGEKTNWVMHEFRLEGKFSYYNFPKASKDEWVVCKVFHKNSAGIQKSPVISTNDHLQVMTRMTSFVDGLLDSPPSLLPPLVDAPPADYDNKPAGSSFTNNNYNNTNNDIIGQDDKDEKSKFIGSAVTACSGMSLDHAENSYYSNTGGLNNQYKTFLMRPYSYNFNTNSYQASPVDGNQVQPVLQPNYKHNTVPYSQISAQLTFPNHPHGLHQCSSSFQGLVHHEAASSGGANTSPDRIHLQEIIGRFKVEQFLLPSSNNHNNQSTSCCMISHSQDTGLSTADMNTEISSSVVSKQDITSSVGAATSGISCNKSNYDDPDDNHDNHDHHVSGRLVGAPSLSYLNSFWEY